jgi:hypothetical protein
MIRALAVLACFAIANAATAQDWNALADVETVDIVTHDEDGEARETTIWLVVHQDQGYIRTGGTRWGANIRRDPDLLLRAGGEEFALRTALLPQGPEYDAITAAFRTKYGFEDALIGLVRGIGGPPMILRLDRR